MKVKVLSNLNYNGQLFEPGAIVDLDEATVRNLVASNVVTTGKAEADAQAQAPEATPAPEVAPEAPKAAPDKEVADSKEEGGNA